MNRVGTLDALGTAITVALVGATLYGSLVGDSRQQNVQAMQAQSPATLVALAEVVIAPYVSPVVEAKPLEEARVESDETEDAPTLQLSPEDQRIIFALGEFDVWIAGVWNGRTPLIAETLHSGLSTRSSDLRNRGATAEEIGQRIDSFLKAVKTQGIQGLDLEWLETEAGIQRNLALSADLKR